MPRTSPYGTWKSPITADVIAAGQIGLGQIAIDGDDVYWIEARPADGGRIVVVRARDGELADMTPPPLSARTRVHEYGGGAFAVEAGAVCFSNFGDQQVYLCSAARGAAPSGRAESGALRRTPDPEPLTALPSARFADFAFDRRRRRVICVCEDHAAEKREPTNLLVAIDLAGGSVVRTLAAGHDFYSSPCLSPDGARLAWLTWDHPAMPWDGSQLWVAAVGADGSLGDAVAVAGGPSESVFQPQWSPAGSLYFVSDRSGWWNLYRWSGGGVEAVLPRQADFGTAQWVFGLSTYGFESPARLVCSSVEKGIARLGLLRDGQLAPYDLPFTDIIHVQASPGRVVFRGAGPRHAASIVELDPDSGEWRLLRHSSELDIEAGYLSSGEAIEVLTAGGARCHAFFYPPCNRDFDAPAGERPPLLVMSHGGPTAATSSGLSPRVQYWTSRGVAVVDVNYRGSTGYGRAYRDLLKGQWGVADVDDCVHAARFLVESGRADRHRLAITGGSAGGYTTLCALTFRDLFKAGASYYGVSDLEALADDTHKFESRYEESLVGPYPERRDLYRQRSPIHSAERLSCPIIFFQGLDDRVVPPSQTEKMVEVLRSKGLPVEYLAFEGEAHGFRRAETIKRCLEAELAFYGRVFGFEPS